MRAGRAVTAAIEPPTVDLSSVADADPPSPDRPLRPTAGWTIGRSCRWPAHEHAAAHPGRPVRAGAPRPGRPVQRGGDSAAAWKDPTGGRSPAPR